MKGKDRGTQSRFLLTRGSWPVPFEMTVISFGWAFTLPYFPVLQVIWAIGWSMVALAALIWLPRPAVLAIGIAIVVGHNLTASIPHGSAASPGWRFRIGAIPAARWAARRAHRLSDPRPDRGDALGYGMGPIFLFANARDRTLRLIGLGMIAAFLPLRLHTAMVIRAPGPCSRGVGQDTDAVLQCREISALAHYVCATLGPVLLLFPTIGRWQGRAADMVRAIGAALRLSGARLSAAPAGTSPC